MSLSKTEQNILESAETVFLRKGLEASTMLDIAKEANISRTLLHYYHRNKSTLFQAILLDTLNNFIPKVVELLNEEAPLLSKTERIINCYIELLMGKPLIPYFLMIEVRRDPNALIKLIKEKSNTYGTLGHIRDQLSQEMNIQGSTLDKVLAHFFTTLYGLLLFPFLSKPVLDSVFLDNNEDNFRALMEEKKKYVLAMIATLWKSIQDDFSKIIA